MEAERVREVERWERPPCYVDAQEACPLARLAEGAKARPEGAWDEEKRAVRGAERMCRESLVLRRVPRRESVSVRQIDKARVDADVCERK